MKYLFVFLLWSLPLVSLGQLFDGKLSIFFSDWDVLKSEYLAKTYVADNILTLDTTVQRFYLSSNAKLKKGELISFTYNSEQEKGLLLGFWGGKVNENGVLYNEYSFTHFNYNEAIDFIESIESHLADNADYLNTMQHNLSFLVGDFKFIVSFDVMPHIRVFWNGFDAYWNFGAFKNTKFNMNKKLKLKN